jgi:hypothetical protein
LTVDTVQPQPQPPAAPPAPAKANGLATYFSIIIAPRAAFATLARLPMWGWAAIAGMALTLVGTILALPALEHFTSVLQHARFEQLPADQQAQANARLANFAGFMKWSIIFGALINPWVFWLVGAVVFVIGAALSGGDARWSRAWVASVNAFVIFAIATLLTDIILMLRGPQSANSVRDLQVLPSLAPLFHSPKLAALFASYNFLYVWFAVVCVIALEQMLRMRRVPAVMTVLLLTLLGAAYAVVSAK